MRIGEACCLVGLLFASTNAAVVARNIPWMILVELKDVSDA
jgi:hypothetical protein